MTGFKIRLINKKNCCCFLLKAAHKNKNSFIIRVYCFVVSYKLTMQN